MQLAIRSNLEEVSFMRPVLILLLVLYHSMAIHTGNWEMPNGGTVFFAYKALGKIAYAFFLESFVFVSGYIWAFQHEIKGKKERLGNLCLKKSLRLIIPTILFGLLYHFLLEEGDLTIYHLIEGPGHLWFLPMLFECFLISRFVLYKSESLLFFIPLFFLIGIFTQTNLPFRLSLTLYYLPFFLLGYSFYDWYGKLQKCKIVHISGIWLAFFVAFGGMIFFRPWLVANIKQPIILGASILCSKFLYSLIGTIAFLMTSVYLTTRFQLPSWYLKLGSFCMGVYIFQQFVLEILYYHSPIPSIVPDLLLPILGFTIALAVSLALTYLLRTTKLGKQLL